MSREFTFQDPGEGIHEGEIVEVKVAAGDEVDDGDTVLVIETDKATTEVPSPYSGRIEGVEVSPGDIVTVGDVLLVFDDQQTDEDEQTHEDQADDDQTDDDQTDDDQTDDESGGRATAVGELPEMEDDSSHDRPDDEPDDRGTSDGDTGPVPASPATRRLARELGVELSEVSGSGPNGRVTADDVRAASSSTDAEVEREPSEEREPAEERLGAERSDHERWGPVERVELRGVRRSIAAAMTTSWSQIPHVTHHDLADITELERFRRAHTSDVHERGGDLSLMILVMKALAGVIERHPRFNASLDADAGELVLKRYRNVGIAVDTDEGLIVPVVRDVDRKPITDLAVEVTELVERTRRRELTRDEMQGGSITVTNVGPLGGTSFTPIIRHPEVAIVGMARARLQQIALDDPDDLDHLDDAQLHVRLVLPLSISFDHRVNDGADAARFTSDLVSALSDPESLLLNI